MGGDKGFVMYKIHCGGDPAVGHLDGVYACIDVHENGNAMCRSRQLGILQLCAEDFVKYFRDAEKVSKMRIDVDYDGFKFEGIVERQTGFNIRIQS